MRRLVLLAVAGLLAVAPAARGAPDPLRPQQWGLRRARAGNQRPVDRRSLAFRCIGMVAEG